jgi:hypothetical protein
MTDAPLRRPPVTEPSPDDELRALLARAELSDLERIAAALDRWPRPPLLGDCRALTMENPKLRGALEEAIQRALVRDASSEVTHLTRKILRKPPRADLHAAVTRAAKRLGVRVPIAGSLSGRLAALTTALVDKTFASLPAEEQQRLLAEGLDRVELRDAAAPRLARAATLPALHATLGPVALVRIAEAVVAEVSAALLGREVARAATRAILSKTPLISATLGPIVWATSAALLAWELQRPADRKVIPTLVILGLVALR